MNKRNHLYLIAGLVLGIFLVFSCRHELLNPLGELDDIDVPGLPLDCDTTNFDFAEIIFPLIQNSCAVTTACHGEGSAFGDYTSFSGIKVAIDNGRIRKRVLQEQDMPPGAPLSECDQALLKLWLDSGAPGDGSTQEPDIVSCDSTNFDFTEIIFPLIQNKCASVTVCHGSGSVFGELTRFATIKNFVDNGKFERRVLIDKDMPPAAPLSACDQELISNWLDSGAPGDGSSDIPDQNQPADPGNCDPNVVYFEQDVLPILLSNCALAGCHDSKTREEGFDFTSYNKTVAKDFKRGRPRDTEMYEVLTEEDDDMMPPPPMAPLSAEQIKKIYDWIKQGGKNLTCDPGTCDTQNVTFSADILAIIENKCKGCHSGSNPKGNVLLTNYTQTRALALTGRLSGTINASGGFPVMPPLGKLPDCEIQQIEAWIANGAPNN